MQSDPILQPADKLPTGDYGLRLESRLVEGIVTAAIGHGRPRTVDMATSEPSVSFEVVAAAAASLGCL